MRERMNAKRFNKLIQKIHTNQSAFDELYHFYFPNIVMLITKKYRLNNVADDIAQEFFVKLLSMDIKRYIDNPTAWVYTSCDNLAKDYIKREQRYNLAYVREDKSHKDEIVDELIWGDYLERLNMLDEEVRKIIDLHLLQGYSLKEVAEIMNLNHNTVRQKYLRAKAKVQRK